jgi:hypothetical protein
VVTAAAATAFDALDVKPTPEERAPDVVQAPRVHASPSSAPSAAPAFPAEPWADYLERAGRDAFAERDYSSAVRYWREASRMSPRHAAALEGAIAGAQELAAARR